MADKIKFIQCFACQDIFEEDLVEKADFQPTGYPIPSETYICTLCKLALIQRNQEIREGKIDESKYPSLKKSAE